MMKRKITASFKYIYLCIASFFSIFPFIWMVISATNTSRDIMTGRLRFGGEFFTNFSNLLNAIDLGRVITNSFIIAISTTVLALIFSSMAGYAFEVFRTKLTNLIFSLLLMTMMLPFAAIMIPLFRMMTSFGLLNRFIAVILPVVATPFLIFFFRQNTKSFPKDLIEAARIDGLAEFNIFLKVYVPSMKSTYAAAAIITFMGSWNNYLWPLLMLQTNDRQVLPLVLAALASSYNIDFGMIMVGIIMATLPMVIVFFAMQKHFVSGMVGSVK